MYLKWFYLLAAISSTCQKTVTDTQGTFWQFSDVHFDRQYSHHGDPHHMCHFSTNSTPSPGYYGNYLCDTSWSLLQSAVTALKTLEESPDFILWTGDTVPHIDQSSVEDVFQLISNVTRTLRQVFPAPFPIIPVLGNHDAFPSNQMPLLSQDAGYYSNIISKGGWSTLLSSEEQKQFLKGGFYSRTLPTGLHLLVLNSNLWYSMNKRVASTPDPNNQFTWLTEQLQEAENKGYKVYIVAHICPGGFERTMMSWFYDEYNSRYLQIVRQFHASITAHFCGHEHTDSFRILTAEDGSPSSLMFLAPALTPWRSTLPGVGANNPSVRLYQYSQPSGRVLNYLQYYMNLTSANSQPTGNSSVWQKEYDPLSAFSLPDCSAESFVSMATKMTQKDAMFRRYLQYNSVGYTTNPVCDQQCFLLQTCAILNLDLDQYRTCLAWTGSTPLPPSPSSTPRHPHKPHPLPRYVYYIIGGMGLVIVLLAVVVSCLCARHRRRHMIPFKYGRFGGPIN